MHVHFCTWVYNVVDGIPSELYVILSYFPCLSPPFPLPLTNTNTHTHTHTGNISSLSLKQRTPPSPPQMDPFYTQGYVYICTCSYARTISSWKWTVDREIFVVSFVAWAMKIKWYKYLYKPYSRKFSWGSIFADDQSLPFCGFNFRGRAHSRLLYCVCTVQSNLFRGFNFHS